MGGVSLIPIKYNALCILVCHFWRHSWHIVSRHRTSPWFLISYSFGYLIRSFICSLGNLGYFYVVWINVPPIPISLVYSSTRTMYDNDDWCLDWPNIIPLFQRVYYFQIMSYSNIHVTSFFRFVDKRAMYRWYNLIRKCAGECDWLFRRKCTCWWIIVCSNLAA